MDVSVTNLLATGTSKAQSSGAIHTAPSLALQADVHFIRLGKQAKISWTIKEHYSSLT